MVVTGDFWDGVRLTMLRAVTGFALAVGIGTILGAAVSRFAPLRAAIGSLIDPDVVIDNEEVFSLHRVKDGRDVLFLVNPTGETQVAEVSLAGELEPVLWDPSSGEERPGAPVRVLDGRTGFRLALPPVGSAFVLAAPAEGWRVVESDVAVDEVDEGAIRARGTGPRARVVVERDGRREELTAEAQAPSEPVTLDGAWEFSAPDGNALVIGQLLSAAETAAAGDDAYAAADADESRWLPVVPGAWQYQQPAEPDAEYPFAVWYRARFEAGYVPERLDLLVDGFAGADWRVYVNGQPIEAEPRRSDVDSQMQVLDLGGALRTGSNVIAVRLTLAHATDGLLDLVKLVGAFRLDDGVIVAPSSAAECGDWTAQGHPFYSGCGVYRTRAMLPAHASGTSVTLEADAGDDALEVLVNGRSAGVRLWGPYAFDVTDLLVPDENEFELRVSNTPVNLLEGQPRRSGLVGPPRLVPEARFELALALRAADGIRYS
jgi:hypothetical protein